MKSLHSAVCKQFFFLSLFDSQTSIALEMYINIKWSMKIEEVDEKKIYIILVEQLNFLASFRFGFVQVVCRHTVEHCFVTCHVLFLSHSSFSFYFIFLYACFLFPCCFFFGLQTETHIHSAHIEFEHHNISIRL